ncbi:MAG: DMT family transporter [Methylobacterium mesophilicum]|nr:DMT family transporter [Methylobacterium mesophilicum]
MSPREWAMLLLLSVLWGGSFFFNGVALHALPPLTLVVLRVGLAALILNAALPLLDLRLPRERKIWAAFFVMGLLNNAIPFTLIVWGQTAIPSGLAAILNATTPLFTVLVAHGLTADEKLTSGRIAGMGLGLIGVVVMVGPSALAGLGADVLAQLAVLGAALSYAFAGVYGRRFRRMGVVPLVTAAGQVSASTLMLLPLALLADRPWTLSMPGLSVWAAVLGLAALSTALAYVLYFRILSSAGATNLLLVAFLIPVSAILLGAAGLGERLGFGHYLGMALIGCGFVAIDGRLPERFRKRNPANGCRSHLTKA